MATRTNNIFRYLYLLLAGMFFVSLPLVAGVKGMLPHDIIFAYSMADQPASLMVVQHNPESAAGDTVVSVGAAEAGGWAYTVLETVRADGMLQYQVALEEGAANVVTLPAREMPYKLVLSVPLIGEVLRMLVHPIGFVVMFGAPLFMFVIDLLMGTVLRPLGRSFAVRELVERSEEVAQAESPLQVVAEQQVVSQRVREKQHKGVRETARPTIVRNIEGVLLPHHRYGV